MSTGMIVMLVILVILIAALAALYFFGKRMEKKQAEQKEQMDAVAQTVTMMVIDKKKMKLKDAGLPAVILENTPKYLRRSKVPIVKAKVGPKMMIFICDSEIFETIPVKKEVKASISGLYLTSVRGLHGTTAKPVPVKKGLRAKLKQKYTELSAKMEK